MRLPKMRLPRDIEKLEDEKLRSDFEKEVKRKTIGYRHKYASRRECRHTNIFSGIGQVSHDGKIFLIDWCSLCGAIRERNNDGCGKWKLPAFRKHIEE